MSAFDHVIRFSVANRVIVFAATLALAGFGLQAMTKLPIDAVPDVTNVQVQVLTDAKGLGPIEVERFVTFPIELELSGLPDLEEVRSLSTSGLSVVTVVFEEHVDIHFARQLVQERLNLAKDQIPEGFGIPRMGPLSTGLGEVYQFEVKGDRSLMELRSILDWQVIPRLRSVPGVVEVNPMGGELKTYEVKLDPSRLASYGLSLDDVFHALENNNANAGGAYITKGAEQVLIRAEALVESLDDLRKTVLTTSPQGVPVVVGDVAEVAFAPMVPFGAVTRDGRGEVVTGTVMMRLGENPREVVERVKKAVEELGPALPEGVTIDAFYDRTTLVSLTIRTVATNLIEGGLLVIFVLFLMLRNLRAGLVVAGIIPLCMLVAFIGMRQAGLSGNLMSLGAIDFGLIVDGALIVVENSVRHIAERSRQLGRPLTKEERNEVVASSTVEIRKAVAFGEIIIASVYLPVLALTGMEGKMFRPMALTVIFALMAAFVFSMTLVPALAATFLPRRLAEKESGVVVAARRFYLPILDKVMSRHRLTAAVAGVVVASSVVAMPFLGAEFLPRLEEGALALQAFRLPSASLAESVRQTGLIEKTLEQFPEVTTVVSKTGRAEIATDPMGPEISDIFVMLKPRKQWRTATTQEGLVERMNEALERSVPGAKFSWSQPIELRVSELLSGVSSDVGVKIFGEDLPTLELLGQRVARVLSRVPGAADVNAEQVAGLPVARVQADRQALARYRLTARSVLDAVETLGGREVGVVLEGQQRFALQVRWNDNTRRDASELGSLMLRAPSGAMVPLREVARITVEEGPALVSRENVARRLTVEANVRGRDLAGFVADAQAAVEREVKLPVGYRLDWGGTFENLQSASKRLAMVVPLTLLLIFGLLYLTFHEVRPAVLIFLNIPFAVTGGVAALALRGLPLSISAAVGFIALFGVAVLNGLVLVWQIRHLRQEGLGVNEAAKEAARVRLRPVLTTALVASLGFLPMALSSGAGAEVQRPLATVVIGGLVSSTLLTLLVLPTVYRWFDAEKA